jgi:hypothetical protein
MLILTVVHICLAAHGWTPCGGTGHQRQVNGLSGNLIRRHYPSKVTRSDGTSSPTTCWADYVLAPNVMYGTTQGSVKQLLCKLFSHPFSKLYP